MSTEGSVKVFTSVLQVMKGSKQANRWSGLWGGNAKVIDMRKMTIIIMMLVIIMIKMIMIIMMVVKMITMTIMLIIMVMMIIFRVVTLTR